MKAKIFVLCGLPGSSKSTWAKNNKDKLNAVVHSSDSIREQLGDINDQSQNELVFKILHKRIKEDLLNGKNVILDATNLKRKNRRYVLNNILKDVPCEKICVLFATPFEICKRNNANRDRKVPEHVISYMYKNFEVPCKQEQWDDIQIVWWDYEKDGMKFDYKNDLEMWRKVSQDNPHHTLSIGDHMIAASSYYSGMCSSYEDRTTEDKLLSMAILMHDCGKIHVKSFFDKNGNISEKARYYEHHNVGAYQSLFYLKEMRESSDLCNYTDDDILYISLLINCHMRHFMAYKDSEKAKERDRKLFGDDFMHSLDILHMCDLKAH